jgi:hypothetical protein
MLGDFINIFFERAEAEKLDLIYPALIKPEVHKVVNE